MDKKLELGSRVVKLDEALQKYNTDEDDLCRGVIEGISRKEGKVFVKWDDDWQRPNPEEMDLLSLISEEEAEEKVSELEKEYKAWANLARKKCEEASKLIGEAAAIAEDNGYVLGEENDVNYSIKRAMGNAGWNTSSWNC